MPYDCLPLEGLPEPIDPSPSPEALAIAHETHEQIHALFLALFGASTTAVLTALYFDQQTTKETARRLGLSEQQVRWRRETSLKTLRLHPELRAFLIPTATR